MNKQKKVRIHYYEEPRNYEFIVKLPFHQRSMFIRTATTEKIKREKKRLSTGSLA